MIKFLNTCGDLGLCLLSPGGGGDWPLADPPSDWGDLSSGDFGDLTSGDLGDFSGSGEVPGDFFSDFLSSSSLSLISPGKTSS